MKIYTTIDCIKLTDFEKILLVIIKGVLYDFYHSRPSAYCDKPETYNITIKRCDVVSNYLTTFKIEGNTPVGLFDEVSRLITPFTFGFKPQGGYNNEDKSTSVILQRFELKRETLNYTKAYSINS